MFSCPAHFPEGLDWAHTAAISSRVKRPHCLKGLWVSRLSHDHSTCLHAFWTRSASRRSIGWIAGGCGAFPCCSLVRGGSLKQGLRALMSERGRTVDWLLWNQAVNMLQTFLEFLLGNLVVFYMRDGKFIYKHKEKSSDKSVRLMFTAVVTA